MFDLIKSPYRRSPFWEGFTSVFDIFGVTSSFDYDELPNVKPLSPGETIRKNFAEISEYLNEAMRNFEFHVGNRETEEALKNSRARKNLTTYKSSDELFEDLGI